MAVLTPLPSPGEPIADRNGKSTPRWRAWLQQLYDTFTGGQIRFPATQNASTDPHVLDDYEEGTWTPAITFGGAAVGVTYSRQDGTYVKIGGIAFLRARLTLTSKGSSTGVVQITGLPFNVASTHNVVAIGYYNSFSSITSELVAVGDGTAIDLRQGGSTALTNINLTNTSDIVFDVRQFI